MLEHFSSRAVLKEWAITATALAQGRQIVLLRKGGLLDEDGSFALEHSQFWLMPTWFHQERGLVKPAHLDLWEQTPRLIDERPSLAYIRHFARVERVWELRESAESALQNVPHVWSQNYLDLRFSYQADKPLLCAALRVWELESPIRYGLRAQDRGCRSWIETAEPLEGAARAVFVDEEFRRFVDEMEEVLR